MFDILNSYTFFKGHLNCTFELNHSKCDKGFAIALYAVCIQNYHLFMVFWMKRSRSWFYQQSSWKKVFVLRYYFILHHIPVSCVLCDSHRVIVCDSIRVTLSYGDDQINHFCPIDIYEQKFRSKCATENMAEMLSSIEDDCFAIIEGFFDRFEGLY